METAKIDRRLLVILSIVFAQIAGAALILPVLPLFAERQFGIPPATVTLLVSSYFLAQFFAGPYLGRLSDQRGRVPLLVISQLGSALSFFMMAAAGSAAMLFFARVVDGITGGNIIVAQAYITDVTPREKRTEALGYIYAVFGIGFIIGPALGGILSAWLGARMPFVIAGAVALLTAFMSWSILEETVQNRPVEGGNPRRTRLELAQIVPNTPLLIILVVAFVGQFGLGMLQSTFALYGDAVLFAGRGEEAANLGVGLLLATVGLGQFVTQGWLLGPLKQRFGDARLVIVGTTLRALGLAIFAAIATVYAGVFAAVSFSIGQGLMMPPLQSLSTRTVAETVRGGVLGVYQSSVSLATIISTAIAGTLYSIRPSIPYWIGAALSLIVLVPAWVLLRLSTQKRLREGTEPQVGV